MKKLTLLICTVILFTGCEKKFDNVIDPKPVEYQFTALTVPDIVDLQTNPTIIPKIEIKNLSAGSEVWFDVASLFSNDLLKQKVVMKDDGQVQTSGDPTANDNIYSGKFTFAATEFTGEYELSFYVKSKNTGGGETETKIALKTVFFNGASRNEPPVISNLSMPESIDAGVVFKITLNASDPNGLADIQEVSIVLTAPGVTGTRIFYLRDDGSAGTVDPETTRTSGDITAGDGVYSIQLSFNALAAKVDWSFSFQAKDKSNITGNIITQKLKLK